MSTFEIELRTIINKYCIENQNNTPDHILSKYMVSCLNAFNQAIESRENWYGREFRSSDIAKGS